MKARPLLSILLYGVLVLWATGCDDDEHITGPSPDPALDPDDTIEATILESGPRPSVDEPWTEESSTDYPNPEGDYLYVCTDTQYDIWAAPETYPIYDPNAEWLYPGCLLKGATINEPTPAIFPVGRGPGTICISNISGAEITCQSFNVTNISSVLSAANRIIGSQPEDFPAVTGLHHVHFESEDQLRVAMKASASFFGLFKTSTNFSMESSSGRAYSMVELSQKYYTLIYQPPDRVRDFFSEDATTNDIVPYLSPGNPPAWVSSVTYGRMCYLIVSSTESRETVETSVEGSFIIGGGETDIKHVSELEGLEIYALFIGGSATDAIQAVQGGLTSLDAFLEAFESPSIGTALPLSYVLRDVYHDYPVIKNGFAAEYTLRDCSLVDSPDFVVYRDFYVEGGDAYCEVQAPRINHPNTISFVTDLSYKSGGGDDHDDDYAFKIDMDRVNNTDVYRISTASNGGADPLSATYGRIVTWGLPDYVEIDRPPVLEIDGDQTAEHYIPSRPGKRSLTIVEPLWYWTIGNDKLQFYCSTPTTQSPYVRIWSNSENANHGERIKFRVTTLYWPEDKPISATKRLLRVNGDGSDSTVINERRKIVSPITYQVSGDHDYEWNLTVGNYSATLQTNRGRPGACTEAKVFELSLY